MKKQKFLEVYKDNPKIKDYLESGHVWEEDDGFIDVFASERGAYCNGPRCVVCGYDPCWHCEPIPKKCPVKEENYVNQKHEHHRVDRSVGESKREV